MTQNEATRPTSRSPLELALEKVMQLALDHQESGRLPEAEGLFRAILQKQGNHPEANFHLGRLAVRLGQPDGGLPFLKVALTCSPEREDYWHTYIEALIQVGDNGTAKQALIDARANGIGTGRIDALAAMLESVSPEPAPEAPADIERQMDAEHSGRTAIQTDKNRKARKGKPSSTEVSSIIADFSAARFAEVVNKAAALTKRYPDDGFGWKALGTALHKLGWAGAVDALETAAALLPADAEVRSNLGSILTKLGRSGDAEKVLRSAVAINPSHVMSLNNLGLLLHSRRRFAEAETVLRQAIMVDPNHAMALGNLGVTLKDQSRLIEAESLLRRAVALMPESVRMRMNLGVVLYDQGRMQEAETEYRRALQAQPDDEMVCNNLGNALRDLGRQQEAETMFRRALEIDPEYAEAWNNLGNTYISQGRIDDAETCYRKALQLDPKHRLAHANLLFALNYHPDKSPEEIYAAYREFDAALGIPVKSTWQPHLNRRETNRRLKVGYVSPDFRQHSVRHFLEPLLAHHDKDAFEVYAYAELATEDAVSTRYRGYVNHWVPTAGLSDAAVAELIRRDDIDILVDVAGHTAKNRLGVFARKPAPVSLTWLGYGYTTGLSAIDYFLTDDTCTPPGAELFFSEKPWRMPTPLFAYRPAEGMGDPGTLPAEERGYVTFGTLTRAVRINHRTVRVWADILRRVPGSRLVVDSINFREEAAQASLTADFARHGIEADRLEIGFHSPPWDVLRGIDIGLDCFPHNSGTTLVETLYMGVPFVTLAGRPSVGMLGSSILAGAGHREWIAQTEEQYVGIAVTLASNLAKLGTIRAELRGNLENGPIMDEIGFTRKVESAYRDMFKAWSEKQQ